MKSNIAFIGSVGVPNNYGGFEMFLESCCPELLKDFSKVYVTCDKYRYQDKATDWRGVSRVFIPVRANGALSILHDLLAFLAVFFRVRAIIVLGVSGGVFFPLFRLLCAVFRKKLVVNVDGVEWRRGKFSKAKKWFLYSSDRLAQYFAHCVVVDNEGLRPYLAKSVQRNAELIAYPGDHVIRMKQKAPKDNDEEFLLTICRIEPENNCHVLIEAFKRANKGKYIFVGNWNASDYGRKLRALYADVQGLEMRDPVYDKNILASLREACTTYLHGHSVGGTNPSLVEMLFYDCKVLAFDCTFNRYTGGITINYFAGVDDLASQLATPAVVQAKGREAVRDQYSRHRICGEYVRVLHDLIGHPTHAIVPVPAEAVSDPLVVGSDDEVVEAA